MRQLTRYLLLVLPCLVFPLSMTYAYNSESYDGFIRKSEEILPIPTLKVLSIGSDFSATYAEPEAPAIVYSVMPAAPAVGMQFSLSELDDKIMEIEDSYLAVAAAPPEIDEAFIPYMRKLGQGNLSAKAKKVKEIVDGAIDAAKFIDQLTGGDLVTMPLVMQKTIGEKEVSFVFNKARIYPQFTLLEVFVKVDMGQLDIDGNPVFLYFAADDILFSQEDGLIGGTIGLVNDYALRVGDSENAAVWLKGMTKTPIPTSTDGTLPNGGTPPTTLDPEDPFHDKYYNKGGTFVSFDCDGFKEMGIAGEVVFSRSWVLPTDDLGIPIVGTQSAPAPRVRAEFSTTMQSTSDIFIGVTMPNFTLTKFPNISLDIDGAFLDMSEYRNPEGVPEEYGIQPNFWEGVYIKNIGITLPEPFKRTCGSFTEDTTDPATNPTGKPKTCRIRLDVTHLLIDEFGVDGSFAVEGQAPFVGGPIMDGEWGWNMNYINIDLQNSDVVGFGFGGGIGVPILDKDDPIAYTAGINFDNKEQYIFTISQIEDNEKSFPIWNAASVNLTNKALTVEVLNGEFDASISLSGSLTIGDPKDKKEGAGGSLIKMPSIEFTNLEFSTKSPKVKIGGFGLNGTASASAVNFPIVPTGLNVVTAPNDKLKLSFGIILNLMKTSTSTISATGGFEILGSLLRDRNGAQHWENESLDFTGANVTVNVPQFYGTGNLNLFKNDEVYGKGFSANITAKILGSDLDMPQNLGQFSLNMAAIFGSSSSSSGETGGGVPDENGNTPELTDPDNYRYWMVDGLVQSDQGIPIFPPFEINGFGGGAFYHMRPHSFNAAGEESGAITEIGESTTGLIYRPNADTGLGLKFTTSIVTTGGLMDGLLTAIIRFSPSGTLQNITFWGTVDIMKPGKTNTTLSLDITERKPSLLKSQDEMILDDTHSATVVTTTTSANGIAGKDKHIKGQIGISLDFEDGFTLHGYAKVTMKAGDLLKGVATLDVLIDQSEGGTAASQDGDWHFYMGGYYQNDAVQVVVPGFFNEDELVVLEPASVQVNYGENALTAQCYFLTGNKIPGPPPAPNEVIAFFKDEDPAVLENNRDGLTCGGKSPAAGTGIAFGASARFSINEKIGGVFGSCALGFKAEATAIVGFDLSLLKYDANTTCNQSSESGPQGLNGFRATGRAYALISLEGGHVSCFPLPDIGIGVKVEFDLFKPSYLGVGVVAKAFGERVSVDINIGEQCGIICN